MEIERTYNSNYNTAFVQMLSELFSNLRVGQWHCVVSALPLPLLLLLCEYTFTTGRKGNKCSSQCISVATLPSSRPGQTRPDHLIIYCREPTVHAHTACCRIKSRLLCVHSKSNYRQCANEFTGIHTLCTAAGTNTMVPSVQYRLSFCLSVHSYVHRVRCYTEICHKSSPLFRPVTIHKCIVPASLATFIYLCICGFSKDLLFYKVPNQALCVSGLHLINPASWRLPS